jgi:hypothetical protein
MRAPASILALLAFAFADTSRLVHRNGERVRINAGTGGNTEVWSFVPPRRTC